MEKLDSLFNKNVITVLILVVVLLLVVVFAADLLIVFKSPAKDTLLSNLFPTSTLDLQELVTRAALTAEANATPTPEATITAMAFTPFASGLTPAAPSQGQDQPTVQPSPTPLPPTPTRGVPTRTAAATKAAPTLQNSAGACIPPGTPQTGKVLEIVDGDTIRVLIGGPVYTVRYIGLAPPANPFAAQSATYANSKLVYGKEVILFSDVQDKDAAGRLLRYVKAGNTFVNQELLKQGWGSALDAPPNSACEGVFSAAEQAARGSGAGQWNPTLVPPTP